MAELIRSPFPGMDPYLDLHPGDIAASLAVYSAGILNEQLPSDLVARIDRPPNHFRPVYIRPIDLETKPVCVLLFHNPNESCMEWGDILCGADAYVLVNLFRFIEVKNGSPYFCSTCTADGRKEQVHFSLRARLPSIRLPLRQGDPDAVLDLQAMVDRAYYFGAYHRSTRYTRDPHPPLTGDDARWADELLKAAGKR